MRKSPSLQGGQMRKAVDRKVHIRQSARGEIKQAMYKCREKGGYLGHALWLGGGITHSTASLSVSTRKKRYLMGCKS